MSYTTCTCLGTPGMVGLGAGGSAPFSFSGGDGA